MLAHEWLEPQKRTRTGSSILEISSVAKEWLINDALGRKSNVAPLWTVGEDTLSFPEGISFLRDGRLAVSDSGQDLVAVFDSNGRVVRHFHRNKVTQLLGGWHFKPQCLTTLTCGSLAVTDTQNKAVNIFDADGNCVRTLHERTCRPLDGAFSPFDTATTASRFTHQRACQKW